MFDFTTEHVRIPKGNDDTVAGPQELT